MPTIAECAWTAGIIDGEGTIYVSGGTRRSNGSMFALYLRVANTDPRMIVKLKQLWGGGISVMAPPERGCAQPFLWTTSARKAACVLRAVRPFLITKSDVADLGIELQERISTRRGLARVKSPRLTLDEICARMSLYARVREANKRGPENTIRILHTQALSGHFTRPTNEEMDTERREPEAQGLLYPNDQKDLHART